MGDFNDTRLYVGNLPDQVDKASLFDLFERCGAVRDVFIPFKRDSRGILVGESKGYAFVEMDTPEEARDAIQMMHGQLFISRKLIVRVADQRAPRTQ